MSEQNGKGYTAEEVQKIKDVTQRLDKALANPSTGLTSEQDSYQMVVMDKIKLLTEPPYTATIEYPNNPDEPVEVKKYPPNYFNSDYLALKWFVESINFNKEICDELLFNDNGNEFRVSVTNIGLATLAHWRQNGHN